MKCAVYEIPPRSSMVGRLFKFDSIEEVFERYFWDKENYRIFCGAIIINKDGQKYSIIKEDFTYYNFSQRDGLEHYFIGDGINGW